MHMRAECDVPTSSLDPHEASRTEHRPDDVAFRHSHWARTRARVRAQLRTAFPRGRRAGRFADCGQSAWVFRHAGDPGRFKVASDTCRDRWCRACQRDRGRVIARNLAPRLTDLEVRLVTLTLRHRDQALRHQVDRLYAHFRTLRRAPFWRDAVDGGVGFLEVKWNPGERRFHPHLHALVVGRWISQKRLADEWRRVTGDSFVVDVRLVRDPADVAHYVVKYASKPGDTKLFRSPEALLHAMRALHGRRTCFTFGVCRGWQLTAQPDTDEWILVGSLGCIRDRAADGDPEAFELLARLGESDVTHAHRPAAAGIPPPSSPTPERNY
jgi:hypothetical protein